jgi:hypothetical protein
MGYMYLRKSRQKRVDGSVLTHLQLAENVWDPEKRRAQVKILYNCGRADDPQSTERLGRTGTIGSIRRSHGALP